MNAVVIAGAMSLGGGGSSCTFVLEEGAVLGRRSQALGGRGYHVGGGDSVCGGGDTGFTAAVAVARRDSCNCGTRVHIQNK